MSFASGNRPATSRPATFARRRRVAAAIRVCHLTPLVLAYLAGALRPIPPAYHRVWRGRP